MRTLTCIMFYVSTKSRGSGGKLPQEIFEMNALRSNLVHSDPRHKPAFSNFIMKQKQGLQKKIDKRFCVTS